MTTLPQLPPVHRTQNALRCMACKKPYTPPATACAAGAFAQFRYACECGCGTFEGVIGYEPQPQFTAEQMRTYGAECAAFACSPLQARIDALMLEYCPDEMTAAQLEEWGRYQRPYIVKGATPAIASAPCEAAEGTCASSEPDEKKEGTS